VSLLEDFNSDIPQLSHDENSILIAEFSEKEIFEAIDQIEKNKAPGPDGFPAEFFQNFWGLIKDDLMVMFRSFFNAELPLFRLNYGTIILLPKK
jgi:mannosylglycoprotein endo-beta-mannosidase